MGSKFLAERSKLQQDLLKELIESELNLEQDSSQFKVVLSAESKKLPNKNHMSVNPKLISRRVSGLVEKFRVACQRDRASQLESLVGEYLERGVEEDAAGREDVEVEYSILHFLMAISDNPVNREYQKAEEEEDEEKEELVDWHAILVQDFLHSDPSEEDISSGEEVLSGSDIEFEDYGEVRNAGSRAVSQFPEATPAVIPEYSEICEDLVKQYWKKHTDTEPLTELQIIREILTMLQGSPTSFIFPVFEDKVYLRDDIFVEHYSQPALYSILHYFEKRIRMVQRLHFLCDDVLNYVAQPSHPYGSRSFQAFACALYMYLQQLTNAMTRIELKVKEQREVITVTMLREAVREHFEIIPALYDMVEIILEEIEVDSPSVCVTKLLNILFESLQLYESMGVLSQHITKVLLTILLCAFQPLLATVDVWLSRGDLDNSTGELYLTRDPDISCSSHDYWSAGLTLKHSDRPAEDQVPKIMLPLCEKMLKAGKAIELISSLGKLGEPDADLFHLLISKYCGRAINFDPRPSSLTPAVIVPQYQTQSLLIKSYFNDLSAELARTETTKSEMYTEIYGAIGSLQHIIPSTAVEKILLPLMEERCTAVSFSLLRTLKRDFALDEHISTLRKVLLLEAGLPMSVFCEELFKDVYEGEQPRSMTPFLRECMSGHTPFTQYLRMEVARTAPKPGVVARELDVFQSVRVEYSPPFPTNIVLDEELLEVYQRVFTLLLQVKYTAWCVFPLALNTNQQHDLPNHVHCFTFELIHFIKVIQSYAMQRVLHCTGADMRRELDSARELDEYVSIHNKYCYTMEEYCLLTQEFTVCLRAIRHALTEGVKFARERQREQVDFEKLEQIMGEVRKCIRFVTTLVKKRNQAANVPQPHFDWLETVLG